MSCLNISQCLNPSRGSQDREDTSFDALWDLPVAREIHTVDCESIGTGSQSPAKLPVVVQDCGMASRLQIVAGFDIVCTPDWEHEVGPFTIILFI